MRFLKKEFIERRRRSLIHLLYSHFISCIVNDSSVWFWCEVECEGTRHQSRTPVMWLRKRAPRALLFGSALNGNSRSSSSRLPAGMFVGFSNKVHTLTADHLSAVCIFNLLAESATAWRACMWTRRLMKDGVLALILRFEPQSRPDGSFSKWSFVARKPDKYTWVTKTLGASFFVSHFINRMAQIGGDSVWIM